MKELKYQIMSVTVAVEGNRRKVYFYFYGILVFIYLKEMIFCVQGRQTAQELQQCVQDIRNFFSRSGCDIPTGASDVDLQRLQKSLDADIDGDLLVT